MAGLSFEEKINIVANNYAKADIDFSVVEKNIRDTYIKGFKRACEKLAAANNLEIHSSWTVANNMMICVNCGTQFDYATSWNYCPVCGTQMDGSNA